MSIRAIMTDLDGTLAESKARVSDSMGIAIAAVLEHMPFAVISGGAYEQFQKQLLTALPETANLKNLYLFPTSGSRCYTYQNGEWQTVYEHLFSEEERVKVLDALTLSLKETGLDTPPSKVWGLRIAERGSQITFSGLGQEAPLDEKKKWDPDFLIRAPLRDSLTKRLPGFLVRANATTSIDITKAGIDKAFGLHEYGSRISIPLSEILYIGDALFAGGNDEPVMNTEVQTRPVTGPNETEKVLREIVKL